MISKLIIDQYKPNQTNNIFVEHETDCKPMWKGKFEKSNREGICPPK